MAGVQRIGVLFFGVVWGCFVGEASHVVEKGRPWLEWVKKGSEAHMHMRDCFTNKQKESERRTGTMEELERWQTTKMRQMLDKQTKYWTGTQYKVKRLYTHLWLAGIANGCPEKNKEATRREKGGAGWCKLYAIGRGANIALRCTSEEHKRQFKKWSQLVEVETEDIQAKERNVSFSQLSSEKQSFLCTLNDTENSATATANMPDTKQKIGDEECELDEKGPQDDALRGNCYYEMKWLGEKVAAYTCPIRRARNCAEAIKREFEIKQTSLFGKNAPEIVEEANLKEKLTSPDRICSLKGDSKALRGSVPAKFKFNDKDKQQGDIWCTLPEETSDNGKITCKFLPRCEVAIRDAFEKACTDYNGLNNDFLRPINNESNSEREIFEDFSEKCESHFENSPVHSGRCSSGKKELKFTTTKNGFNRILSCSWSSDKINCRLEPLNCEQQIKNDFGQEGKTVLLDQSAKQEKIVLSQRRCTTKNPKSDNTKNFDITEQGSGAPKKTISCKLQEDSIQCRLLSSCELEIMEQFGEKCKDMKITEKVDFDGRETEWTDLPKECSSEPENTAVGTKNCENGPKNLTFKITRTSDNLKDRKISCHLKEAKISCTLLPPTCKEMVQKQCNKVCKPGGASVNFGSNVSFLNANGGTTPDDKCPLEILGRPPQNCKNREVKFKITSGQGEKRKISCRVDTDHIQCDLLPPTCEEYVRDTFNEKCNGNAREIVSFEGGSQYLKNQGGKELNNFCPLEVSPQNPEKCKNRGNTLTLKINDGKEKNKTLSCTFFENEIKCNVLGLSCAQEIQKELFGYHQHSSETFLDKVEMEPKNSELKLNEKSCKKTEENYGKENQKVFDVKENGVRKTEILCIKNAESKILCSLLPPRCEIEKYKNEEKSPLRCERKEIARISRFQALNLEIIRSLNAKKSNQKTTQRGMKHAKLM